MTTQAQPTPAAKPAVPTLPKKPGLYICEGCGIGAAVDVAALEKVARSELKIATCSKHAALCSEEGTALIARDTEAGTVDGIVVAACSARVMGDRFHFAATPVVRASLREQVAWSQPAKAEDTQMLAADLIRMRLAQVKRTLPPLPSVVQEHSRTVLAVGVGLTGLPPARESAKAGQSALLME